MGNLCTCLPHDQAPISRRFSGHGVSNSSGRWSRTRSSTGRESSGGDFKMDDPVLREQALAAAAAIILQKQRRQSGGSGSNSLPFDRSASLRCPPRVGSTKSQPLPRSCSSRPRSLTDPLLQPQQLLNQEKSVDDLETAHFVLVHGGGFGAWCWYKTIALLEEAGYKVTAIDLTGSGIHSFDTNEITSLLQYVKPLSDFLDKLADGERVILVGHDFGGACVSYAMESVPHKISKSIFIAAAMLTSGQSTLELFSQKAESDTLMGQAQQFLYANGKDKRPTAIDFDKSLLRDLLFNQSPTKDVALASVSMRPIPFAPVLEKLSLSDQNYGSVRRFYIQTLEDNAVPIILQEQMVTSAPPEQVFILKGADHSPFFSKPQALHKLLVEISRLP
ncbi:hypothetical protein V2J09_017478 [Rumex salicifolius]